MTDYYAILEISRAAQADDIAKAYRRAALTYNPSINHTAADGSGAQSQTDDYQQLPDIQQQQQQQRNQHTSMVRKALSMQHSAADRARGNGVGTVNMTTSTLTAAEKQRRFKLVSQAYTVLSQPKLRAVYDAYGEDGVRHGGTGSIGIPGGLAIDDIDPEKTFRTFFGVDSPFQVLGNRNILSAEKGQVSGLTNTQHHFFSESAAVDKSPPPAPPVETELWVTLEDIDCGALRCLQWTNKHIINNTSALRNSSQKMGALVSEGSTGSAQHRGQYGEVSERSATAAQVFNATATVVARESPAAFELPIPVGVPDGSVLTLKGLGNTQEGCVQGDVLVKIRTKPHERFRRGSCSSGTCISCARIHDLHITVPISLTDALCGVTVSVKTIDHRELDVLIDQVVHPSFKKVLIGEGMHTGNPADADQRGDLVIECTVNFPQYLTAAQKEEIRRVLNQ